MSFSDCLGLLISIAGFIYLVIAVIGFPIALYNYFDLSKWHQVMFEKNTALHTEIDYLKHEIRTKNEVK